MHQRKKKMMQLFGKTKPPETTNGFQLLRTHMEQMGQLEIELEKENRERTILTRQNEASHSILSAKRAGGEDILYQLDQNYQLTFSLITMPIAYANTREERYLVVKSLQSSHVTD
ncbi:hypothetical protein SDJN03_16975, partial [Cucurbita argyrosperma subsp. sororia]